MVCKLTFWELNLLYVTLKISLAGKATWMLVDFAGSPHRATAGWSVASAWTPYKRQGFRSAWSCTWVLVERTRSILRTWPRFSTVSCFWLLDSLIFFRNRPEWNSWNSLTDKAKIGDKKVTWLIDHVTFLSSNWLGAPLWFRNLKVYSREPKYFDSGTRLRRVCLRY